MTTQTAPAAAPAAPASEGMTHRQVLEALSGLLLGMLVTILSSTVVSTALPRIVSELGGSQSAFTWVVTASLLAMTISTPIWGKLADLFSRKLLVQIALVVFVVGSALAGLSQNVGELIGLRVLQGLGAGGLTALSQVILADIISPRDRGRYMGYLGATMAVGTVAGPLLGGVLTDSPLGWRSTFYVGVPFAVIALAVLQKTLHLPRIRREVSIDYVGAILLSAGVATLLIWVTLAGNQFDWASTTTALMVGGAIVVLVLAIVAEHRAKEPILPLWLFRNRTFVFAVIASVAVGVTMFGTSVFLSQYMQIARGKSPTVAGLISIPMAVGSLVAGTVIGQIITRTGRWKRWMVLGGVLLIAGSVAMGTIDYHTSFTRIGGSLLLLGLGVGMVMQNLVLAVQNTISIREMGAASAGVAFFRSMGGAIGVAALGAVLAHQVTTDIASGLARLGIKSAPGGNAVPEVSKLPPPVRELVEKAYGQGVADIFMVAAPIAVIALIAILCIKEIPLGTKSGIQQTLEAERLAAQGAQGAEGEQAAQGTQVVSEQVPTPVSVDGRLEPVGIRNGNGHPAAVGAGLAADAADWAGMDADGAGGKTVSDRDLDALVGVGGPSRQWQANGAHRLENGRPENGRPENGRPENGRPENGRPGSSVRPAFPPAHLARSPEGSEAGYGRDSGNGGTGDNGFGGGGYGNGGSGGDFGGGDRPAGQSAAVVGVVRRSDGTPVANAALTLINLGGHQVGRTSSGSDGRYQLPADPGGTYVLIASAPASEPRASTVSVGQTPVTVDVELSGVSGLVGEVRSAEDGLPVAEAVAVLTDARGEVVASRVAGADGGFRFDDVGAASYTLAVRAEGFQPVALPVSVAELGETRRDVELVAKAALRGMARDRYGRPLRDARVTLIDANGDVVRSVFTDDDGGYALDDLAAGDYTVVATGYPAVTSSVRLGGGDVGAHDVELGHPEV
ncbi:MFS transporter [Actinopolymorpha sp. NPDC004070]|uniref:MFS transporter n=1 Tax=Actinopolymorpha sp. NPDC004070 TaxID=3154548 RepID=UPI0033AFD9B2